MHTISTLFIMVLSYDVISIRASLKSSRSMFKEPNSPLYYSFICVSCALISSFKSDNWSWVWKQVISRFWWSWQLEVLPLKDQLWWEGLVRLYGLMASKFLSIYGKHVMGFLHIRAWIESMLLPTIGERTKNTGKRTWFP